MGVEAIQGRLLRDVGSASRGAATSRPRPLTVNQPAANAPFWGDYGQLWDLVRLAGIELPGVAKVTGKGFDQRVDRRAIPGQKGAKYTHYGCEPADIEIELQLWEAEHLDAFKRLVSIIKPKNGKMEAHAIYHPALDLYQIRSVLVLSSSLPSMNSQLVMEVTLRCKEYTSPSEAAKSAVTNPTQGPDAAGSLERRFHKQAIRDEVERQQKKPSSSAEAAAP